jgi:hypothetical protein
VRVIDARYERESVGRTGERRARMIDSGIQIPWSGNELGVPGERGPQGRVAAAALQQLFVAAGLSDPA